MTKKYLYTIKWTQPYTGYTPFQQGLWDTYEAVIERKLDRGEFKEANQELERIMQL